MTLRLSLSTLTCWVPYSPLPRAPLSAARGSSFLNAMPKFGRSAETKQAIVGAADSVHEAERSPLHWQCSWHIIAQRRAGGQRVMVEPWRAH